MKKRYHIVNKGELSMRADYMRAEFRRLGGKYYWINQGDDGQKAVLRVVYADNDLEVKYTIEDAKRAGLVKPDSNWEKNPGDMLRARVSTKAIRMVCAEVLAGFPTEEELGEESEEITDDRSPRGRADTPAEVVPSPPSSAPVQPGETIEDAHFEPASGTAETNGKATGQQISRITELFQTFGVPGDKQLESLKKRGATSMADLSDEGAADLLAAMEARLNKQTDESAGQSSASGDSTSEPVSGPCSDAQIEQMKSLVKQITQQPGYADVSEKIKAHFHKHGITKLSDLSSEEANQLIHSLTTKNVEAFFETSLSGAAEPAKNE